MLNQKKILIGVTASISAYKSAYLVREFIKKGAEVKVIMTSAANQFISPLTLSTLSKNPVYTEFYSNENTGEWNNHVDLGMWADVFIVAPASANTIAKMANGICDNILLATYLSAKCPVFFAPAMDLDMYKHPTTKKNIETLQSFGNTIINPGNGELASGLVGEGRLAEPEDIIKEITSYFSKNNLLKDKNVLVSAGPTYEQIDPVRFIGNNSTGKMGFEIAEVFANAGAKVELVSGPTSLNITHPNINRTNVVSAEEMYKVCSSKFLTADITIMSAAIADFTPKTVAEKKIKKGESLDKIELVPTKDVLESLGKVKQNNQLLVGFALETNNELENAQSKLERKNLDFIVLNSLQDKGAGFGGNTNKVTFIDKYNNIDEFELKDKKSVATDILTKVISLLD